ncbi:ATP-binding cassette domain-containing protein [Candidatus Phytoplasma prunorum]|uniref:ATP-binding cassette domain-containing protein n=1 Tax=Candidatus Phytoplasma prunorum TaxID=47565 RepID=UPI002FF2266A
MILLKTQNLQKKFVVKKSFLSKNNTFLTVNRNINLNIFTRETLGIVGESGSGKSTLGKVILQLSKLNKGNIFYYGLTLDDFTPYYVKKIIYQLPKINLNLQDFSQQELYVKDTKNHQFLKLLGILCLSSELLEIKKLLLFKIKIQKQRNNFNKKRLNQELKNIEKQLQQKKDILKNHTLFNLYESFVEKGIDLTLLNENEKRFLRKDLQIIFQDSFSSLSPYLTIGDIIGEGLLIHRIVINKKDPFYQKNILEMMQKCGINKNFYHRYAYELSGGQRQRINIARSLILKPKFVICDEAVSSLDVTLQSQILDLLNSLKQNYNLTYLFITHDLGVAHYICDRIVVMYLGRFLEMASSEEIFKNPLHPYTQKLINSIPSLENQYFISNRNVLKNTKQNYIFSNDFLKDNDWYEIKPNHFIACTLKR